MQRLRGFPLVLIAVGLAARIAPLLDLRGRNLTQFPSEDGYLMLTIARNIGLGRGMSIADGTIATNGTQPFMAYVYALAFWMVGGDKAWGVLLVQVFQIAIALGAALLLYGVGRRILAGERDGDSVAALTACRGILGKLTFRTLPDAECPFSYAQDPRGCERFRTLCRRIENTYGRRIHPCLVPRGARRSSESSAAGSGRVCCSSDLRDGRRPNPRERGGALR